MNTRISNRLLVGLAIAFFLMEMLPNFGGTYGYFIDEFYYIACAKRLALGYVDHPPLAPFVLRVNGAVLGNSLLALRFLPALCGAVCVFLTGLMARRLGAALLGQFIAALCMMPASVLLLFFGLFSMNCFEVLFWIVACFILVELGRSQDDRLWLLFGVVAGLGFQNKHTFVLLTAGVAVGVVLTPLRRHLLSKWFWLGLALAVLIAVPNLYWQAQHDWASLEFYRNIDREANIPTSPLNVLLDQIGVMNPATFPVWAAGVVFFLASRKGRPYRFLGWTFISLLVMLLLAGKSRPDRIAGVYPMMFAGGGVVLESLARAKSLRWIKYVIPSLIVGAGALLAPLVLPILSPERLAQYPPTAIQDPVHREPGKSPIPLQFANRTGWKEFVEEVARVYSDLAPAQQDQAIILAPDYGHAGAIEFYGETYGLPPVYSPHNNYYLWGPDEETSIGPVIAIGFEIEELHQLFQQVEEVAIYRCEYCMGWRDNMPIYLASGVKIPLRDAWDQLKHYGLPIRKFKLLKELSQREGGNL